MAALIASTGAGTPRHDDSCTSPCISKNSFRRFIIEDFEAFATRVSRIECMTQVTWLGVGVSVYDSVARHERDGTDA
jgi:hypothetical protein